MDKYLLVFSLFLYFSVMIRKRISPVSLYGLFGLQWFFYWVFPFLLSIKLVPMGAGGYPLDYVPENQYYFFLFNGLAMIVFALTSFFLYRKPKKKNVRATDEELGPYLKYRTPLFIFLLILNLVIMFLSLKFPYTKMTWWSHSINANLRNVLLALFLFYMLLRPNKLKLYLILLLFCASTLVYGGRAYLLILATAFFFYYYDIRIFKMRHIIVLFLLAIVVLTTTGLVRNGQLFRGWGVISMYMFNPMYNESIFSSYPGFALIDMWRNNKIKYHSYFSSYVVDPFLIFVPQFLFVKEGEAKASYNTLGKWERDHGGRENISPQGGYYYMGEAMQALSVPGIFLVVFLFAIACVWMDKLKYGALMRKFVYYNFVGTVGLGFVSDQFAWCIRSFGMNMIAVFLFIFAVQLLHIKDAPQRMDNRLVPGRLANDAE